MNKVDSPRLFIALDLPGEIAENISRLVRELAGRLEGVRWTPAENIHLTLKFLGQAETERIPQIRNCLDRAADQHLPLEVSLEGLGAFPGGRKPRVIWTGVGEGREKLAGLAEDLDRGLAELGFPR
ncbi:MAG: RNA 2',3'-cyclic phosphodiesterase, partial [Candidatus Erginobacter occultus]|nr:RNA 2',3'-cyclic phosphodiesterase [Candidatus Erginobacter occultus]